MSIGFALLLACALLVAPSWQYRLLHTINVTNWMNELILVEKEAVFGFTQWEGFNEALIGNHLGDGLTTMSLLPDSINTVKPGDRGRKSVAVQSKLGVRSGLLVVDVAHIPEPACGMDASIYLYDGRTAEEGPIRIILSELIGWDPSNTMNFGDGVKHGLARIHQGTGNESFASYANKRGGVILVAQWSADDVRIWDFQGPDIDRFFPNRNGPPAMDIDTSKFGPGYWNPTAAKVAVRTGPLMKVTAEVSFCEPNVLNQWDSVTPLNNKLQGFPNPCLPTGQNCQQYVSNNPVAFRESYWDMKSFSYYT